MTLLTRGNAVLVVVDVQDRLIAALPDAVRVMLVKQIATLVESAQVLGVPAVVSEQYPQGLGPTVAEVRDRLGAAFAPIEKIVFSCARSPEFRAALDATGRRDVVLCGVESHVCVLQTAADLLTDGYRVFVPADAVGSRRDLDSARALALMDKAGVTVGTTEMFLFQLLERAGTDEFKQISKLVK